MPIPYGPQLNGLTSVCRRHHYEPHARSIICIIGIAVIMAATIDVARPEDLMELTCTETAQCQHYRHATTMNATCRDGHCQCTDMHGVPVTCEPNVHNKNNIIGGPCPCGQQNTRCNEAEDICYCNEDYVASADRRRCIRKQVPLNAECEMNEQCQASGNYLAICHRANQTCSCMPGFIEVDGEEKCAASIATGVNASCLEDVHCRQYGPNAECSQFNWCVCKEGFVMAANSTTCLEAVAYGRNCASDLQCQYTLGNGGRCTPNGLCGCDENYLPYTTDGHETNRTVQCYRIKVPGQYCLNNSDCNQSHLMDGEIQTMRCVYAECNCIEGYRINKNSQCASGAHDVGFQTERHFYSALCVALMALLVQRRN